MCYISGLVCQTAPDPNGLTKRVSDENRFKLNHFIGRSRNSKKRKVGNNNQVTTKQPVKKQAPHSNTLEQKKQPTVPDISNLLDKKQQKLSGPPTAPTPKRLVKPPKPPRQTLVDAEVVPPDGRRPNPRKKMLRIPPPPERQKITRTPSRAPRVQATDVHVHDHGPDGHQDTFGPSVPSSLPQIPNARPRRPAPRPSRFPGSPLDNDLLNPPSIQPRFRPHAPQEDRAMLRAFLRDIFDPLNRIVRSFIYRQMIACRRRPDCRIVAVRDRRRSPEILGFNPFMNRANMGSGTRVNGRRRLPRYRVRRLPPIVV